MSELPTSASHALDWTLTEFKPHFDALIAETLTKANIESWMKDWSALSRLVEEVVTRLHIAADLETTDTNAQVRLEGFYEHSLPGLMKLDHQLKVKLVDSGLHPEGFELPLRKIQADISLFTEKNLPLITQLTKMSLEYDRIVGAQTVQWEGREITLAQLKPVLAGTDRAKREQAWRLSMERRLRDRDSLNALWQQMLQRRVEMAANAGFDDFRAYKWQDLKRFDYTPEDALAFHAAIEEVVVPAAQRLHERRRAELGVDSLRPWDLDVDAKRRAPLKPFEDLPTLQATLERIFTQVDPVLGAHFQDMRSAELLDLDNRKGKAPGGYCATLPVTRKPFIFMNAVGLHDDVQTLLHEGGHAFHVFEAKDLTYHAQENVPMEFAEVASMAMELLAAPYLTQDHGGFYTREDAARARVEHLEGIIQFWPYMAVVDNFQHWVYTHTDVASDPAQCDAKWNALWDRFMPGIDYSDFDDIKVTGWHRKLHIFQVPFYYVEYGLAQLGAVQVWSNALQDQAQAVADYRRALALGGTRSVPELFAAAGARFAFDTKTLHSAVQLLESTLAELTSP